MDGVVIGPPHALTDGTYVWPADLPYYLRRYHLRLPTAALIHIQRQEYRVPAEVAVASLVLPCPYHGDDPDADACLLFEHHPGAVHVHTARLTNDSAASGRSDQGWWAQCRLR
jgi:hypothetical protein